MAKPSGLPINPFFTLSPIEALTMVEHATAIGANRLPVLATSINEHLIPPAP
jgi:hypothetical protein